MAQPVVTVSPDDSLGRSAGHSAAVRRPIVAPAREADCENRGARAETRLPRRSRPGWLLRPGAQLQALDDGQLWAFRVSAPVLAQCYLSCVCNDSTSLRASIVKIAWSQCKEGQPLSLRPAAWDPSRRWRTSGLRTRPHHGSWQGKAPAATACSARGHASPECQTIGSTSRSNATRVTAVRRHHALSRSASAVLSWTRFSTTGLLPTIATSRSRAMMDTRM